MNCFLHDCRRWLAGMFLMRSMDLFHYHNSVVYNKADCCRNSTQRHYVQCVANRVHRDQR